MFKPISICALMLMAGGVSAEEPANVQAATAAKSTQSETQLPAKTAAQNSGESKSDNGPKAMSGMSILGNQEAPKALVIVPWKSSQLGEPPGIGKDLDDSRQPVDKDVFMRELAYYDIRVNSK